MQAGKGGPTIDELHLCLCHPGLLFRAYLRFAQGCCPSLPLTNKYVAGNGRYLVANSALYYVR